jgi:hypothetical protein
MTRKLKLVPVLLLFLLASSFTTNPGGSSGGGGSPTGGTPVVECKFWGTSVARTLADENGCVCIITHTFRFWIETDTKVDWDCPN